MDTGTGTMQDDLMKATRDGGPKVGQGEFVCSTCLNRGIERRFATERGLSMHTKRSHTSKRKPAKAKATLDVDRLLKTLLPGGIPATTDAINDVSRWLADGERLAAKWRR